VHRRAGPSWQQRQDEEEGDEEEAERADDADAEGGADDAGEDADEDADDAAAAPGSRKYQCKAALLIVCILKCRRTLARSTPLGCDLSPQHVCSRRKG
jgi:hypothetical protein